MKAAIGDLDKVKRVAKLLCMVNSAPDFGQHPLVANGATDLLRQLYGEAGLIFPPKSDAVFLAIFLSIH